MREDLFLALSVVNILLTACNVFVLLVVRRCLKKEAKTDDIENEQDDE